MIYAAFETQPVRRSDMKNLSKILIVTVFFSLAVAFCAYAEETKTPGNVPADVSEAVSAPVVPPVMVEKTTLENLQAAFNGESNANSRYLAFAKKADEEGYGKVASLFRAAARAEQVHLERHGEMIKKMGAVPNAVIETPNVKTTAENIQAAMEGETYEYSKMYPEFLVKAQTDKNEDAIDSFEDAEKAEGIHAGLYKEALANLKSWKGMGKNFYVCPVCGNVMENMKMKNCPICGMARKQYLTVK
jgi:rubrerythrin